MHIKILQKKNVEKVWPANTAFLKQLNSLNTIDTFSCFVGPEVTHQTAVREVPG